MEIFANPIRGLRTAALFRVKDDVNRFSSTPDIFLDSQNDGERESGGDLSPNFQTFKKPKNRFQGTKDRYDNPIPTWFLAPKDCLKRWGEGELWRYLYI
jgi:hypothetical protein